MAEPIGNPQPGSTPPEVPGPSGPEVQPSSGAEVRVPSEAPARASAEDATKSGPMKLPPGRGRAPGGPIVFPGGRPPTRAPRRDEPMSPAALGGLFLGGLLLIALGVGIYVKRHNKKLATPPPIAVAKVPPPTPTDGATPEPEATPQESPPGTDVPPELGAKLAEIGRHAPYLQLHDLERLEATPDAVPPGVKDRLDRWIGDLHKAEDPLDASRVQIRAAAGARDDAAVFAAVNAFTDALQKSCPAPLAPGYNPYIAVIRELPLCIESVAAHHSLSAGIAAKKDYLAKGFSADEALAACANVKPLDDRLRLGSAVVAAAGGASLPAALVPTNWDPVDAALQELGLERPAIAK